MVRNYTPRPSPFDSLSMREELKRRLDKGESLSQIRQELKIDSQVIAWEIHRRGCSPDNYDPHAEIIPRRSTSKREFSDNQKEVIREMIKLGASYHKIRKKLSCGYDRLSRFIDEEGLSDEMTFTIKGLYKRILTLEEHVKLLYELIEEKNDDKNNNRL